MNVFDVAPKWWYFESAPEVRGDRVVGGCPQIRCGGGGGHPDGVVQRGRCAEQLVESCDVFGAEAVDVSNEE